MIEDQPQAMDNEGWPLLGKGRPCLARAIGPLSASPTATKRERKEKNEV